MTLKMSNSKFMQKAIDLSIANIKSGGGPFAAVIVKGNEIIAAEANHVTETNDPTAHAEVNAIRIACKKLVTFDPSGCEIYTSCEPCPMCLGAIYWAHLDKVYYANTKTDAKNAGFDDSFIYEELETKIENRKIPFQQIMNEEAQVAFKLWDEMEEKNEY